MLFADTSYLVALFRENDEKNARAVEMSRGINERVFSTFHVLSEFVTFISAKDGNKAAYSAGTKIANSEIAFVNTMSEDIAPSLEYIRKFPGLSMCDAISAATMDKLAVKKILSFDSDFDRLGFERLH